MLFRSVGLQNIPYQGFPNVRMDMVYNRSEHVNARYEGRFDWGKLDLAAYWQHTEHYMNFLADKYSGKDATPSSGMPMYTKGEDMGWSAKGTLDLGKVNVTLTQNGQNTTLLNAPSAAGCPSNGGWYYDADRKSTRLNSSHIPLSRMPSSA